MAKDDEKCYYCEGRGYFNECPIDIGTNTPEEHEDCELCEGNYYEKTICPACEGKGK